MNAAPPTPRQRAAFSLPEVLVCGLVVACLAALLFPQFQKLRAASQRVECVNRLRQIGVFFHHYLADQKGSVIRLFRDGNSNGSLRWYNLLRDHAGLTEAQARAAFGCPSLPASAVSDWYCYGFRVSGSPGKRVPPGIYELPVRAVENPARFLIAADTLTPSGRQTFRIIPPGLYSDAGIHLRHGKTAQVLFLDGHVEGLDASGLSRVGITEALGEDGAPIFTQPANE